MRTTMLWMKYASEVSFGVPPSRRTTLDVNEDQRRTNGHGMSGMAKKNARTTDLLEDYEYGYCTDGHSDVDDRPWHSVVRWQD
jgi:hypothetical protein